MSENSDNSSKKSYKDTLNLPKTEFPIRPDYQNKDPEVLNRWKKEDLAKRSFNYNKGKEKFILHDGPPYANGNIHLGHAYNKILKDILGKSQRMSGKQVPITPGWDCHGLPIEIKVTAELKKKNIDVKNSKELRAACREYANKWVNTQKEEFEKLGVLMDWDNPYLTMNPAYEANILRAFADFVGQDYIERKNKTVAWCMSCETTLASAEIEHSERKDPSIYVLFDIAKDFKESFCKKLNLENLANSQISFLLWTTTPWTLPLNRAVFLKPKTDYLLLEDKNNYFIVGEKLADKICAEKEIPKKTIKKFNSSDLPELKAEHPFVENLIVPVLQDGFVLLDDGTACVHSAPGCGPEDYEMGIKYNLDIFSPLSSDGKYTTGIEPKELEDTSVSDGQGWVIKKLLEKNKLFHKSSIRHSYPHCWRCNKGLIFRATKQYFCNLKNNSLQDKAKKALSDIKFVPEKSGNNLKATIDNRLEWCLSRQRTWGVTIPALVCQNCDKAYLDKKLINKVADGVEKSGLDFWDEFEIDKSLSCQSCNKKDFIKEKDILDVWFDSGVSHYAVLKARPELSFPADVYLEGRDQARGWFQSSVLTSLVVEKKVCTRSIITHGFTVDSKGQKMSKSKGNIITPQALIKDMGTDALRLWVASNDFGSDAIVSPELLKNVKEVNRKIRNTCRFLLSNLYDFDPQLNCARLEKFSAIDKYALFELNKFSKKLQTAYTETRFTLVFSELAEFCTKFLSSFYLDIIKDRLYCEHKQGTLRRAAQTVSWVILDALTKLMAPVLSFTAEQISDFYQKSKASSIHLQNFTNLDFTNSMNLDISAWDKVLDLRSKVLKSIEDKRETGDIKHSLEAFVKINLPKELLDSLNKILENADTTMQNLDQFLMELFIVSKVEIANSGELKIEVTRAEGEKCPRCWKYDNSGHEDSLCTRCQKVF